MKKLALWLFIASAVSALALMLSLIPDRYVYGGATTIAVTGTGAAAGSSPTYQDGTTTTVANMGSPYTSFSWTVPADCDVLMFAMSVNSSTPLTSPLVSWDYGGTNQSMTAAYTYTVEGTGAGGLWYLLTPTTGTKSFGISFTDPADESVSIAVACYANVASVGTGVVATHAGSTSASTGNISSASGSLVIEALATHDQNAGHGVTPDAGQTERHYTSESTNSYVSLCEEAGAATVVGAWTLSQSKSWIAGGISLNP